MLQVKYAVTFEYMERQPDTHRGTLEATMAHTCAHRALQEAQRALKPRGWSSIVVLLERLGGDDAE